MLTHGSRGGPSAYLPSRLSVEKRDPGGDARLKERTWRVCILWEDPNRQQEKHIGEMGKGEAYYSEEGATGTLRFLRKKALSFKRGGG